jgi:hypothetical protein
VEAGFETAFSSGAVCGPDGTLGVDREVVTPQEAVRAVDVEQPVERDEVLGVELGCDRAANALQRTEGVLAGRRVAAPLTSTSTMSSPSTTNPAAVSTGPRLDRPRDVEGCTEIACGVPNSALGC